MAEEELRKVHRELITANHIVHHNNIVDAYGHVSVRHPVRHDVYIMPKRQAPGVIDSPEDLIEYYVKDSSSVDPNAKVGYAERFIHGEIFKRFPDVQCVVHSHSEDVMPFVIGDVALRPPFHIAGFLGNPVPTFDIAPLYTPQDKQNMLVDNMRFGEALAHTFLKDAKSNATTPDYSVALMRRHGLTALGNSIRQAVFRAHYTCASARMLSSAIVLRSSSTDAEKNQDSSGIVYLESEMQQDCHNTVEESAYKAWDLWVREVETSLVYRNTA